ncbi:MAG: hypothetical protein GY710_24450 [Desulfobacteraceae bacterium]|nr:hypothetical protein [Desulfobacteraceae bacterium]
MPIITKPAKPPLWATNVGVVVEPTEPKKQEGWAAEKPAYQHMNWVHNTNYNWQQYFESYFDAITNSGLKFDDTNSKFGIGNTSFNSNIQRFQVNDITELFSTNHVALFAAPNTNFGPALGLIGDQFGRTLFGYEKGYDTNTGGSFNISIENTRVDFSAFRDGQTANATDLTLNKLGGNVGIGTSNPGIVPGFSRYLSLSILEAETAPAFELEGNRTTDSPIADLKFINNGAEIATVRAIRNGDNTTADLGVCRS